MNNILLFDFDGVIADSFQAAYELNVHIHGATTEDEYRAFFSGNIYETMANRIRRQDTALDYFELYAPRLREVRLFPHVAEALRALSKRYTMILISSTRSDLIDDFLLRHGLRDCFAEILGSDVEKSKAKKNRMVMERYNAQPEQCLFITDTIGDIAEASHCGVNSIAVSWGYHDGDTLRASGAFHVIDSALELVESVQSYFSPKS